jgi:hypothetical protein
MVLLSSLIFFGEIYTDPFHFFYSPVSVVQRVNFACFPFVSEEDILLNR